MQVGTVTVNGRQIGIVTQQNDSDQDKTPFVGDAAFSGNSQLGDAVEGSGAPEHGHTAHHHRSAPHRANTGDAAHHHDDAKHPHHEPRQGERGAIPYSSSGNPFDRSRFAKELEEKPWLKEKIKHITLGENQDPRANLAVVETMMNRAVVRGTSLEAQARRHRSSGVDGGGYYAGWAPHYSSDKASMFDKNLGEALGTAGHGQSNVSNYATDNSSGDLARRETASGAFKHHATINGESFFSPGHAEPAFRDRWQSLNHRAQEFEAGKKATAVANTPFDPQTMAP